MKWISSPASTPSPSTHLVGGKARVLFDLFLEGYPVPAPLCITTDAYLYFVRQAGLLERINLELNRKRFSEMRWEEMWDAALRIKSSFLNQPIPDDLKAEILEALAQSLFAHPLAIRSSAPDEDSGAASFAGLHESYVGIRGEKEILSAIKKVWASLWSDRALLYRQELGLDATESRMAVLVQPFIEGDSSGVAFSTNPLDDSQMVIEAVYGLNAGLVDGAIEPDRWLLNRDSLDTIEHHSAPAGRYQMKRSSTGGLEKSAVPGDRAGSPPLTLSQVETLSGIVLELEERFSAPQDIEWTAAKSGFWLLQARPVTATRSVSGDKRAWYLSLHRSYDNLLELWDLIENFLLPDMERDAKQMAGVDLAGLSDQGCADEVQHRLERNAHWSSVYWDTFIPFAHGARLFGDIYNETMCPEDPFEFVSLLAGQSMLGTKRNELLADCARRLKTNPGLRSLLSEGNLKGIDDTDFLQNLSLLEEHYALPLLGPGESGQSSLPLFAALLDQYGAAPAAAPRQDRRIELEQRFIRAARNNGRFDPHRLLELARASYRLRDDDNIHIGRIAAQLEHGMVHARLRLGKNGVDCGQCSAEELIKVLRGERLRTDTGGQPVTRTTSPGVSRLSARQLLGQPASTGLARGTARVLEAEADPGSFQVGEILVCDAIDPTMTFIAPLAAGIVERRGGMLVHGAIIAREYGIPCVTGITDATQFIKTGDRLTVDGFLGIVTREAPLPESR